MHIPHFAGWLLLGAFPEGEEDDVGSWLLSHDGEALLLEVPPGVSVRGVQEGLQRLGAKLLFITASHEHEDHLDVEAWRALTAAFPQAEAIHPTTVRGERQLFLGGEPLWLIGAPKHSCCDVVTVFRGVAMTGDIELQMLASVNDEVPTRTKKRSMRWLQAFEQRNEYHVHSIVSAHLNDVRQSVCWPDLFTV